VTLSPVILALHVTAVFLLPVALAVTLVRRDGLVPPRPLVYGSLPALLLAPGRAHLSWPARPTGSSPALRMSGTQSRPSGRSALRSR
jgi:hypothetical protein